MKNVLAFCAWIGLVFLSGCAVPEPGPLHLADDFHSRQITKVVLLEIAFLDPPLDNILQDRAVDAIAVEAARVLGGKGYQVRLLGQKEPAPVWGRDVVDPEALRVTARQHAGSADAVVHIQVDHFLWNGGSLVEQDGGGGGDSLDIYGTASLYASATGEELWKGKGTGQSMMTTRSAGLYGPDLHVPVQTLVRSLFATLPPARL